MSDYTPVERKFRIYVIYCETQGRFVAPADDHVRSPPLNNFEEAGEPDEYGGRQLMTVAGGANTALGVPPGARLVCKICGAPLRRVEVRAEGKPS